MKVRIPISRTKALAKATVSFGFASIPVRIQSVASRKGTVSFNILHTCGEKVKQQYICQKDGEVVGSHNSLRGTKFEGKMVRFTPAELDEFKTQSTGVIEIIHFVRGTPELIHATEKVYYLTADEINFKAFGLFNTVLYQSQLVAIGKYQARGQQYLVAIVSSNTIMTMHQLFYNNEIRSVDELINDYKEIEINDLEIDLGSKLLDAMKQDGFELSQYPNEVEELLLERIRLKASNLPMLPKPEPQLIDLTAALIKSLKQTASKPKKTKLIKKS